MSAQCPVRFVQVDLPFVAYDAPERKNKKCSRHSSSCITLTFHRAVYVQHIRRIFFFFLSNDALISMPARVSIVENVLVGNPRGIAVQELANDPARRTQGWCRTSVPAVRWLLPSSCTSSTRRFPGFPLLPSAPLLSVILMTAGTASSPGAGIPQIKRRNSPYIMSPYITHGTRNASRAANDSRRRERPETVKGDKET